MDYEAEVQPRIGAWFRVVFLCIWGGIVVGAILIIDSRFGLFGPMRWWAFGCVAFSVLIVLIGTWPICRTNGFQRWIIRDGVIEYESPTPLLGDSFRANLEDVDAIWRDGDGDFAYCRIRSTGLTHRFWVGAIEGQVFFTFVRDCKKAEQ